MQLEDERKRVEHKTDLYATVMSIEFLENLFVKSLIDYETYVKQCTEEFDRYERIFPTCGYTSITQFYEDYDIPRGMSLNRLTKGKPMIKEHRVIANGRLIIEIVINILGLNDTIYLENYDVQECLRLLNAINIGLSAFESKNLQFENVKKELREWEAKMKAWDFEKAGDLLKDQSPQLVNTLNSALNLFKEINNT
ncbi:hypothetical protein EIN_497540 [Entamoeba invadens IP1]|uniref:Uncharacterized protein n=1 Tax=Entamoeba invadens IP1 TaxID=370355 RepID=A0A0A1UDS7_ENTIV|nr:hypothetical protein EIN_497540 [Entamoeba invadens IP1]ELP94594.1 hypothetical protein EIN_497540 [Entamoeba invadens IP1]|eukprot:XP_004261365.1 hypothetical protein EIN_497540 [Entamoeba invadens IP1]